MNTRQPLPSTQDDGVRRGHTIESTNKEYKGGSQREQKVREHSQNSVKAEEAGTEGARYGGRATQIRDI